MDRRTLLGSAVAAAASAGLSAQTAAPPPTAKIVSSVMLWTLPGSSLENKLLVVARTGIQSVELLTEHAGWTQIEMQRFRRALRMFNLSVDTIAIAPEPNLAGNGGSPLDATRRGGFLAAVSRHLELARTLDAPMVLVTAGAGLPGRPVQEQWASLVESCRRTGDMAAKLGVTLVVEPVNGKVEQPGSFLQTAADGVRLIKEVDHQHVRLIYDLYHEQVQTGDAVAAIESAGPFVKLFHIADAPDRRDPGTGTIRFDAIYRAIGKLGFEGHIAMEYRPAGEAAPSLIRAVDAMRKSLANEAPAPVPPTPTPKKA